MLTDRVLESGRVSARRDTGRERRHAFSYSNVPRHAETAVSPCNPLLSAWSNACRDAACDLHDPARDPLALRATPLHRALMNDGHGAPLSSPNRATRRSRATRRPGTWTLVEAVRRSCWRSI